MKSIYFDNNATTALDPRVCNRLIKELRSPLNASSPHSLGRKARSKLNQARQQIADALRVDARQITFTSGGTESLNLAIRGLASKSGHAVTSSAEHSCVLNTLRANYPSDRLTEISPGKKGRIDIDQCKRALNSHTDLIVITAANNETGAITDLVPIAALAKQKKIRLIVDAVCAFGKIKIDFLDGISALCLSGHKFHGPAGIGLVCFDRQTEPIAQLTGGPQEYSRRAGTENIASICALSDAIALAVAELEVNQKQMQVCKTALWSMLKERLPQIGLNSPIDSLPNTLNIYFPFVSGQTLLAALDFRGISASHGAACSSGLLEASHVLLAMDLGLERANCSVRFSLSKFTKLREIDTSADLIVSAYKSLLNQ